MRTGIPRGCRGRELVRLGEWEGGWFEGIEGVKARVVGFLKGAVGFYTGSIEGREEVSEEEKKQRKKKKTEEILEWIKEAERKRKAKEVGCTPIGAVQVTGMRAFVACMQASKA